MDVNNPARFIDHTLLKADATCEQVRQLCEEAVEAGFASVCLAPVYVPLAAELLYGSETLVGTVIGFPLGYQLPAVKAFEAAQAVAAGAQEIDMVINLGAAREGRFEAVADEIRQVVAAAGEAQVKVIIECCYFDTACKRDLVEVVVEAGAAYVKTSTGFGPGGASLEDVRLLCDVAAGRIKVKAAGGIRDWESCRAFIEAGASRIGTSAGTTIVDQWGQLEIL